MLLITAPLPLPGYEPVPPAWLQTSARFTSSDPAVYLSAMGPLPEVRGGPDESFLYGQEVQSLLRPGTWLLPRPLTRRQDDLYLGHLRAQLYEETARTDEATAVRDAMDRQWPNTQIARPEFPHPPRDLRTIHLWTCLLPATSELHGGTAGSFWSAARWTILTGAVSTTASAVNRQVAALQRSSARASPG